MGIDDEAIKRFWMAILVLIASSFGAGFCFAGWLFA